MKNVASYITGSCRGYIPVSRRRVESEIAPVYDPTTRRGNARWAMEYLIRRGATHYTVFHDQGVPRAGYSNQYCYTVYVGYISD